jgi:hypothetical protein
MSKRGRNLAALAALGALGYMATRPKEDGKDVPVRDSVPVGTRARDEDERDGTTPAAAAAPSKESYHGSEGRRDTPVASLEGNRGASLLGRRIAAPVASTSSMAPAREDTTSLAREAARAGRGQIIGKDKSTDSTSPGTMGAYVSRAGTRATEPAASPARSAAPAASAAQAASAEAPAASSKGLTLGTPTRPAPKAPSIYAGPEAWAEYRKQQTAGMKKGGAVKKMASGGSTSGASRRADGIAQRGKTKGRMY